MVLHALFFVPQVREYIARYRPTAETESDGLVNVVLPPTTGPGARIPDTRGPLSKDILHSSHGVDATRNIREYGAIENE